MFNEAGSATSKPWGSVPEERTHMDAPDVESTIGCAINRFAKGVYRPGQDVVVLCIGSDRSIGDALGPLVGSFLTEMSQMGCTVLGTLDNPVHATNLAETLGGLATERRDPFVVAVDACLGRAESVGMLLTGAGSLKPGAGVNKSLPAVGHLYVTGVVNVGGFMEYFVLQNTRLSLVVRMAKVVASGIRHGVSALLAETGVPSTRQRWQ